LWRDYLLLKTIELFISDTGIEFKVQESQINKIKTIRMKLDEKNTSSKKLIVYKWRFNSAITPEKLEKASPIELVKAYAVLVKLEKNTEGKDRIKIDNLRGHLLWLEKFEKYCANCPNNPTRQWRSSRIAFFLIVFFLFLQTFQSEIIEKMLNFDLTCIASIEAAHPGAGENG
jgi:hypothetical protein